MRILKIQLALKTVIIIGLTIVGAWAISTSEGSKSSLILLGIGFLFVLLLAVGSIFETYKKVLKEELKEIEKER